MTSKQKIAIVVYTALFLLITKVRRIINNLGFRFNGITILSTDPDEKTSQVQLSLLLNNSLPLSVTIDAIKGDLYIQGVPAAHIDQTLGVTIAANAITPLNLIATVDFSALNAGVKANIASGDIRNITLQLVGTITAEGRTFNVNKQFTYYDLV